MYWVILLLVISWAPSALSLRTTLWGWSWGFWFLKDFFAWSFAGLGLYSWKAFSGFELWFIGEGCISLEVIIRVRAACTTPQFEIWALIWCAPILGLFLFLVCGPCSPYSSFDWSVLCWVLETLSSRWWSPTHTPPQSRPFFHLFERLLPYISVELRSAFLNVSFCTYTFSLPFPVTIWNGGFFFVKKSFYSFYHPISGKYPAVYWNRPNSWVTR